MAKAFNDAFGPRSNTALAGAVAGAMRHIAKGVLTGTLSTIGDRPVDVAKAREDLNSGKGIGEPLIVELLRGVPGINNASVRQQLDHLKASGHEARIINEIQQEIAKAASHMATQGGEL
jgi:hypothetical protein